jgi:hypothetical protein
MLREEHRLNVFEKRVLRRIFGYRGRELQETGGDCIMRSFMTCIPHQIVRVINSRRMRWVEHVACRGEMGNAYKILVRKPEGKRALGRCRCRREDNTKSGSEGNTVGICGLDTLTKIKD